MTISFVREYRNSYLFSVFIDKFTGAASFTIYTNTKETFREHQWLTRDSIIDASCIGGISGAMSGALISFGSARKYSFSCQTCTDSRAASLLSV